MKKDLFSTDFPCKYSWKTRGIAIIAISFKSSVLISLEWTSQKEEQKVHKSSGIFRD